MAVDVLWVGDPAYSALSAGRKPAGESNFNICALKNGTTVNSICLVRLQVLFLLFGHAYASLVGG